MVRVAADLDIAECCSLSLRPLGIDLMVLRLGDSEDALPLIRWGLWFIVVFLRECFDFAIECVVKFSSCLESADAANIRRCSCTCSRICELNPLLLTF